MSQFKKEINHGQKGFTLVELMFSLVFISLLLIMIMLTVMQIVNIYNRGLLMKEVNQVGRTITDQMQRTISASVPTSVVKKIEFKNPTNSSETTGGRLCLDDYTYAWNYGKTLQESSVSTQNVVAASGKKIKFVRLPDAGGELCAPDEDGIYKKIESTSNMVEMLSGDSSGLVLYAMNISSGASSYDAISGQRLYFINVEVGTPDYKAIEINTGGRACKPPSDANSNMTFCSINGFSFVARAGNK